MASQLDKNNNLVRRIDAVTGAVTNLGTLANPAFNVPAGAMAASFSSSSDNKLKLDASDITILSVAD